MKIEEEKGKIEKENRNILGQMDQFQHELNTPVQVNLGALEQAANLIKE